MLPYEEKFMSIIQKLIIACLLTIPANSLATDLHYALDIEIDPVQQAVSGSARISSSYDRELTLGIENMLNLTVHTGRIITQSENVLVVKLSKGVETHMSFQVSGADMAGSHMDAEHIYLTGHWYPLPSSLAEYQLTLKIPDNFIAVSEADAIHREQTNGIAKISFDFQHPVAAVHIVASSRFKVRREYFQGIEIETCFFKEDAGLAETYIRHAISYLQQYQDLLTFYPFRRFSIVENILPTGISLPTFTLLGKDVLRLPFIVKTSLGHEILHQWFGNAVYIDSTYGNWAEGLTTYLADHHTAAGQKNDIAYRKQIMIDYEAYIHPDTVIPLGEFRYRKNRSQGVIGYGKAAMFFHALHNRLGKDQFLKALQDVVHQHLFSSASWQDIQSSFEEVAGTSLEDTFAVWLNRTDIPVIETRNARLSVNNGELRLLFDLIHEPESTPLRLPVSIYTGKTPSMEIIHVTTSPESIDLPLSALPSRVVLDEQYDVMRHLSDAETPPVLAAIMGSTKIVVVISVAERDRFQPIIDALGITDITYLTPDELDITRLQEQNLFIADSQGDLSKMLFGKMESPGAGVRLRVLKSPIHTMQRILLADVTNKTESEAIQQKLRHYGRYSDLSFNQGRNIHKAITESENGIRVFEHRFPLAVKPDQIPTLDRIIADLLDKQVIFVGEQHNRFEHHINQRHIIQAFHKNGFEFGVGMEMFKKPYQAIIDAYLADKIDEETFLKETRYFEEWGYDYKLYKPIVDFLKKNNIPLIALNLPNEITRHVSRSGIHTLDPAQKETLPEDLDFSNDRYTRDLKEVFALHNGQETLQNFNYFLQAQVLWDETMADTAHQFLQKNPDQKLIVLAGNGHLRYRYGIPDRLNRRTMTASAVILQDETIQSGIADHVLQTHKIEGIPSPKLGVSVEANDTGLLVKRVVDQSPAQTSGLEKGDIIINFNHVAIQSLADLRYGLFTTKPGHTYPLKVKRNAVVLEKEIQFNTFPPPSPHMAK
jgi:aminopeptidase N